jgi:hypothetical protein
MNRWIKLTKVLLVLTGCLFIVHKVLLLGTSFGRRGSYEHYLNVSGIRRLHSVLWEYQWENTTNPITSFHQFFDLIQNKYPAATGKVDAPNPFPGILLSGHTYVRLLNLPNGLDPKTTPLIWDIKPGFEGNFAVLAWDGNMLKGIRRKQLSQILDVVKQHGGVIYSGSTDPETTPPPENWGQAN